MTDTRSEQLLTAASDQLEEVERLLRAGTYNRIGDNEIADKVRSAHYLIYLVLKPDTRLFRDPTIPTKPPAPSKKRRKK